ncbi:FIST N-terminal domain-containing protein [Hydrogenothermus marinus]|uniref:FIST-like protein n=1 Tax=Hydrogenothermus marinus TaxID=133270 RepID=A0A3M0B9R3_9AQUI|nr:FIST N-terminal domain-containing protein [Hydrogenothermus marinus]RMA93224.1 FIST-like protein [Hydrogenothermus marinus]
MKARVFKSNKKTLLFALEELKENIKNSFKDYDFLLFAISPNYDYNYINHYIKKVFETDNYVAFHAIDAFCDNEIVEGVSVAVFKFENKGKIKIFYIEDIDNKDSLIKTAEYLNNNTDKLHIILAGLGNKKKTGTFIEELSEYLNYSPINNIIGGISSGYKKNNEVLTYQFIDNKIIKNGFVILSFENIEFAIDIALGFKPYGITYTIEKAEGYKLFSVDDGKSFVKIAKSFFRGIDNPKTEYLWYCPIYILDDKEGYVAKLRTIADLKEDYVEFYGPLKDRQRFKLSFATADDLLKADKTSALKVNEKINGLSEIIFNFSCIARQYVLEDKQTQEIETYTSILNSHLFGFFTFGEIGPDKYFKKLKFYNETSLILAMREK